MEKHKLLLFTIGVAALGMVMRIPFTIIPTVLKQVADGLHVPISSLGILTTIPLLMFAIVSPFAPRLAQQLGLEKAFALVLGVMVIGSLIRIISFLALILGTIIIGACIAILNVLLPSAIIANAPERVGFYTMLYTLTMGVASTTASVIAGPIVQATNWVFLIILLSLALLATLLIWSPNLKHNHVLISTKQTSAIGLLKNRAVIYLLVFGGLQSMLYYTTWTWLPTMAEQTGLSQALVSLAAGVYSILSLPMSLLVPNLVTRISASGRRLIMGGVAGLGIIAVVALFFPIQNFAYWLAINILLGLSSGALFPYLLTTLSLKTSNPQETAMVSGIVQSGGYLLTAIGPILFGFIYGFIHSWGLPVAILLVFMIIMTVCLYLAESYEKVI